jgi:hypothetical protein
MLQKIISEESIFSKCKMLAMNQRASLTRYPAFGRFAKRILIDGEVNAHQIAPNEDCLVIIFTCLFLERFLSLPLEISYQVGQYQGLCC